MCFFFIFKLLHLFFDASVMSLRFGARSAVNRCSASFFLMLCMLSPLVGSGGVRNVCGMASARADGCQLLSRCMLHRRECDASLALRALSDLSKGMAFSEEKRLLMDAEMLEVLFVRLYDCVRDVFRRMCISAEF